MLEVSHQVSGIVVLILLGGIWWVKRIRHRRRIAPHTIPPAPLKEPFGSMENTEHRVLMYLMTQKTESLLAALAKTIEQERQKLGVIVRNPTLAAAAGAATTQASPAEADRQTAGARILTLAEKGNDVSGIARRLNLYEEEVDMVVRLKRIGAAG